MKVGDFFWGEAFEKATDLMSAADAQLVLLKQVREARLNNRADNALQAIEAMLESKGSTFWKLTLGQRRQGKRRVSTKTATNIYIEYGFLRARGNLSKSAIGTLANKYGFPDEAIRSIIRREKKREAGEDWLY